LSVLHIATAGLVLAALAAPAAAEHTHPGEVHYRRICFICHDRGVQISASLGAPRLGDRRAWEARARRGVDALFWSVVHRKADGGFQMPTADLTHPEIRAAIEFMVAQVEKP
jgi:cytochrome c5